MQKKKKKTEKHFCIQEKRTTKTAFKCILRRFHFCFQFLCSCVRQADGAEETKMYTFIIYLSKYHQNTNKTRLVLASRVAFHAKLSFFFSLLFFSFLFLVK